MERKEPAWYDHTIIVVPTARLVYPAHASVGFRDDADSSRGLGGICRASSRQSASPPASLGPILLRLEAVCWKPVLLEQSKLCSSLAPAEVVCDRPPS